MLHYIELFAGIPITDLQAEIAVKEEIALTESSDIDETIKIALEDFPYKYNGLEFIKDENKLKEMCASCYFYGMYMGYSMSGTDLMTNSRKNEGQTVTVSRIGGGLKCK